MAELADDVLAVPEADEAAIVMTRSFTAQVVVLMGLGARIATERGLPDADRFAARMNGLGLPGVHFRPTYFEPTFQKHARTTCGGCQLHVTDRAAFKPVITGVRSTTSN